MLQSQLLQPRLSTPSTRSRLPDQKSLTTVSSVTSTGLLNKFKNALFLTRHKADQKTKSDGKEARESAEK